MQSSTTDQSCTSIYLRDQIRDKDSAFTQFAYACQRLGTSIGDNLNSEKRIDSNKLKDSLRENDLDFLDADDLVNSILFHTIRMSFSIEVLTPKWNRLSEILYQLAAEGVASS